MLGNKLRLGEHAKVSDFCPHPPPHTGSILGLGGGLTALGLPFLCIEYLNVGQLRPLTDSMTTSRTG